jgi:hypothetical protein
LTLGTGQVPGRNLGVDGGYKRKGLIIPVNPLEGKLCGALKGE